MLLMHANDREDIKEAFAGDIVALAGLKDIDHRRHAVRSDQAGDPRADGIPRSGHRDRDRAEDQGRPGEAGRRAAIGWRRGPVLPRHDRSGVAARPSSRAWASCISTSRSTPCAASSRSRPMSARRRWPYRETITKRADVDYTHKKQTGGSGQFARVKLTHRAERGRQGLRVRERDRRRHRCRRNTSRASRRACESLSDRRARRLPDGRLQGDADRRRLPRRRLRRRSPSRSPRARRSAKARCKAAPKLLEPIMKVEVVTPEDYIGGVIGDLNSPPRPDAAARTCAATRR